MSGDGIIVDMPKSHNNLEAAVLFGQNRTANMIQRVGLQDIQVTQLKSTIQKLQGITTKEVPGKPYVRIDAELLPHNRADIKLDNLRALLTKNAMGKIGLINTVEESSGKLLISTTLGNIELYMGQPTFNDDEDFSIQINTLSPTGEYKYYTLNTKENFVKNPQAIGVLQDTARLLLILHEDAASLAGDGSPSKTAYDTALDALDGFLPHEPKPVLTQPPEISAEATTRLKEATQMVETQFSKLNKKGQMALISVVANAHEFGITPADLQKALKTLDILGFTNELNTIETVVGNRPMYSSEDVGAIKELLDTARGSSSYYKLLNTTQNMTLRDLFSPGDELRTLAKNADLISSLCIAVRLTDTMFTKKQLPKTKDEVMSRLQPFKAGVETRFTPPLSLDKFRTVVKKNVLDTYIAQLKAGNADEQLMASAFLL